MDSTRASSFQSLTENVGRLSYRKRTLLLPQMSPITPHLFAGAFRAFGIQATVMDTYKGLDLGLQYTSGKECYPCQVTTGDILHHLKEEQKRLGPAFNAEDYVCLMPDSDGPCRFGMYNKYQRIVLDSLPGLKGVKITSPTTRDAYSLDGMIDPSRSRDLRKALYVSVVVADILERLLWRIRPYETEPGMADAFVGRSTDLMRSAFEAYAGGMKFGKILDRLAETVEGAKAIINPSVPPKPLIGIVGEMYLRTHVHANQDLIRVLERYGAEVLDASFSEFVNYVSYEGLLATKRDLRLAAKQLRFRSIIESFRRMLDFGGDLLYKEFRQRKTYGRVRSIIHLADDHKVAHLDEVLKEEDVFTFDVPTEACLSVAAILDYARSGYNGVVNVYPFTCMPSMTTSAIAKPLMRRQGVPYLDVPCDSSVQPGREAAIRTFMYQAQQHFKRNGRKML
jgi:predicted nucleotide-binding protein (sugar kinase/HSP70/actin superfamily)